MYFHSESGTYVHPGQPFTLKQLLPFEVPAVMGEGAEEGVVVELEPARTEQQLVDVQYPANWLSLASDDDKAALGLQEVVTVGTREDDRYFWVNEEVVGAVRTIVNKPKDAAMVAAMHTATAVATIANLEAQQVREMARFQRESTLESVEKMAFEQMGLKPDELYALGAGPNPPNAALNYKRLKDIDAQVKAARESIA